MSASPPKADVDATDPDNPYEIELIRKVQFPYRSHRNSPFLAGTRSIKSFAKQQSELR